MVFGSYPTSIHAKALDDFHCQGALIIPGCSTDFSYVLIPQRVCSLMQLLVSVSIPDLIYHAHDHSWVHVTLFPTHRKTHATTLLRSTMVSISMRMPNHIHQGTRALAGSIRCLHRRTLVEHHAWTGPPSTRTPVTTCFALSNSFSTASACLVKERRLLLFDTKTHPGPFQTSYRRGVTRRLFRQVW